MKKFDCSIIYEFNCLQTIYMFSMKVNEFFNRPFACRIDPHTFVCGSFSFIPMLIIMKPSGIRPMRSMIFYKKMPNF